MIIHSKRIRWLYLKKFIYSIFIIFTLCFTQAYANTIVPESTQDTTQEATQETTQEAAQESTQEATQEATQEEHKTNNAESISTGKFNVISTDKTGKIALYDTDLEMIPSHIMPQQEYDIIVDVYDRLGIINLESLDVKLWEDKTGTLVRESSFNDVQKMDGKTKISISWKKSDMGFKLDSGEDNTWQLIVEKCKTPTLEELQDSSINEYQFVFRVKIGKVATMTLDDSKWQLAYKTNKEYGYYSFDNINGFSMEWYCEVQAPNEIHWGNLLPGIDYDSENSKQRAGTVKYISNGTFSEMVKFDGTWNNSDAASTATLTEDPLKANEFALKVSKGDNLENAKQIPSDGSFVYTSDKSPETDYLGETIDDYYFYIKLNKEFDIGMYTGKITFGVSN